MGKRGRGEGPLSPRRIVAARKHIQALELRAAGLTWDVIARQLGYRNHTGALMGVKAALDAERFPPVEEYRRLTIWRLTKMLSVQWPRMLQGDPVAFDKCDKAIKGLREVTGLDAPARVGVEGPGGGPITILDLAKLATSASGDPADDQSGH